MRPVKAKALCYTRVQMVLMGTFWMDRLGLRKDDLLVVEVKISAANGTSIACLGGSHYNCQSLMAMDMKGFIIGQEALMDLGWF